MTQSVTPVTLGTWVKKTNKHDLIDHLLKWNAILFGTENIDAVLWLTGDEEES